MRQSIKQIVNISELAAVAQRPLVTTNSFLIAENTTHHPYQLICNEFSKCSKKHTGLAITGLTGV